MPGRKAKTLKERAADAGVALSTMQRRMKGDTSKGDSLELMKWRERKERAEALKAEKFLEMVEGGYLPRDEVAVQQARIAHVCNALIRAIPAELSPLVAGLTPAKVERVAKEWAATWSEKLADANDAVWTEAEKAIQRELRGDLKKVAAAQARKNQ